MQLFDAARLSDGAVAQILSFLNAGGVIGFPTDTAYGLGADPFSEKAIRRIFEIKGRPEIKPILLIVNSIAMAESVATPSALALDLVRRFWPGPLTVVLPARENVPELVTAGTRTVGVRWPAASCAMRLLDAFGKPVTATSANLSGHASAVTADEVRAQLGDRLEILIDGGVLPERGGSTILDLTREPPRILREGPITEAALKEALQ